MAEKKTEELETIQKMSFKAMGCDAKDAIRQDKNVYMCRVYGEATEIKSREARNGDIYSYLLGDFRAETGAGKRFESSKLFLPGSLLELVESSLKAADGKPVSFAFDVFS